LNQGDDEGQRYGKLSELGDHWSVFAALAAVSWAFFTASAASGGM
jgi:hypothetical protein